MATDDRTTVGDVMSAPLLTVSPDVTIREAARRLVEADISALVVTAATPSLVTSTDLLAAVAAGDDPGERLVADVMTESVETVPPKVSIVEAAAMMTNLGVQHLPVVDDDYVGMVSATDVTEHLGS